MATRGLPGGVLYPLPAGLPVGSAGPEPGSGSNILGGVTTIGGHPWAAGVYDDGGS
ncbi:MAG TPA: hypothetical protein VJ418_33400 [Streptosporangiaceae bacterium]|nr:hypothetical protein [Streptosporangiaceae bacterium]